MKRLLLTSMLLAASVAMAVRPPDWLASGVVYQVPVRTFTRGGDFKSATEMLPYVVSTGATVVHLTALPEETAAKELKAFVAKAHELGLKVLSEEAESVCDGTLAGFVACETLSVDSAGRMLVERVRDRLSADASRPDTASACVRLDAKLPPDATEAVWAALFLGRTVPVLRSGDEIADPGDGAVDWGRALTESGMKRLGAIRKLAKLRRRTPAFASGKMTFVSNTCPERVISFVRTAPDDTRVLVVVNLSSASAAVKVGSQSFDLDPWQHAVRSNAEKDLGAGESVDDTH